MTSPAPVPSLITGGAGFIGANLADRLLARGCPVTIADDLSRSGSSRNLEWLRRRHGSALDFHQVDIRTPGACNALVSGAEVVYHLAAQTAVTTSLRDPRLDFEVNALGTFNLLESVRTTNPSVPFFYSSTNKVYGGLEYVPTCESRTRHDYSNLPRGVDEGFALDFHSPYGCSKGAADQYVRDYGRIFGLSTVVFRQSCIYGPRQMGVEDQGWVAWFIIALVTGREITIYGDGKQVRDLLYIDDLLDCYDAALNKMDSAGGSVYNVGGGRENAISIWAEFRPLLEDALGRKLPEPRMEGARSGDQPVFIADTSKARHELGWEPRVGVQEGIRRLAEWVRDHPELFV